MPNSTTPTVAELRQIAQSNPPRKVKKASVNGSSGHSQAPIRLKGEEYDATSEDDDSEPSWTPSSPPVNPRGRKPGNTSLSRSAREAQRRENHSRIEKLRRTKINDALATLRRLVPAEYSRANKETESNAVVQDEDNSTSRKRPAKEKEFKLEILVKTVAFMQDLIARNEELEKQVANSCSCEGEDATSPPPSTKRKSATDQGSSPQDKKRANLGSSDSPSLPSISEWLPNSSDSPSYLPSPPSSTHFTPAPSQFIPPLSLGPSARGPSVIVRQALPSPDEESAASMLLHIASRRSSNQGLSIQAHTPSSIMGIDL